MSAGLVSLERPRPEIALLRLNRPERRNALSMKMIGAIISRLDQLADDRETRVVVLTGNGASFCAGADLKEGAVSAPGTEGMGELGLVYKTQEYLAAMILRLYELPQPVIAAVNGDAVGGGFAMALACDLRVAATRACFGSVFIRAGLSSCDVGTSYLLPRIVGYARASELMLTGRLFDAAEAEQFGLLHRRTEDGAELDAALETAEAIAANNEYGVWMTKKGLQANADAPSLRHAMELENRTQTLGWFSGNMKEAMQAFAEKRPPAWKRL